MAGDHRCPVCQATFTRPQHVSRHMRSHTGDRPYKCQHCDDQFARSDLLSRHINKCHPGQKAAPKDTGAKRKTNLVNRATTSKQACDQCVQNSLTCDGANPCSKCLTRKVNCTFVKFHRQTAPVGPGHPSPASQQQDVSPTVAYSQPLPSDNLLLPSTQFDQFAFNPPAQFYQPQLSFAGDHTRLARSASVDHGSHRPPITDFMRSGTSSLAAWDGSPDLSGTWNDAHTRAISYTSEDSGSEAPSSARSSNVHLPLDLGYTHSHQTNHVEQPYDLSQGDAFMAGGIPANNSRPSSSHFHSAFGLMSLEDPRSENLIPFFQDLKDTADPVLDPWPQTSEPLSYTSATSSVPSHNSFNQPQLTPREAETRELREFWKQYMRTPLTGPQQLQPQIQSLQTPTPSNSSGILPSTPSNGRRPRVNSLPPAKTPTADMYGIANYGWYQPRASLPPPRPASNQTKDDLKSYEAAVMARKPSTALVLPTARGVGSGVGLAAKRQTSTSELANVFGPSQASQKIKFAPPPISPIKKSGLDGRPTFKRNASQSLGPEESKRVKGVDEAGSDGDDEGGDPESDVSEDIFGNHHSNIGHSQMVHAHA